MQQHVRRNSSGIHAAVGLNTFHRATVKSKTQNNLRQILPKAQVQGRSDAVV
jgi:hypothetical protein